VRSWWSARWDGTVEPWPYALFRVGVASLILVRTTTVLEPLLSLDHHLWVRGIEYAPWVETVAPPASRSPLVPLPDLGLTGDAVLVVARTALAALLLLGVRVRWTAGLLAAVGFWLVLEDRYRYLHHLHLLWTSCALLALCPSGQRLSVERLVRRGTAADRVPRGALQLLRSHALVIYASAGVAKLDSRFLDGSVLEAFAREGLLTGPAFEAARDAVGIAGLAKAACAVELALVPLLAVRRTRLVGVALGVGLHLALDRAMLVSTFGATMALYLALFLPWREFPPASKDREKT